MKELKKKKLFLLDMDGTIYLDNKLIPGAIEFLNELINQNKKYVFLTNNSSKGIESYLYNLNKLKIKVDESSILTSGTATAMYIIENSLPKEAYVVGTDSFKNQLKKSGIKVQEKHETSNLLIVGFDTELNYKKILDACELINKGIKYIATNPDLVCPIANGRYIPDCGSICTMLETATGIKPKYIGKPRKEMVEIVVARENVSHSEVVLIGDRLYTDIACGINAGITTILVLTGETKRNNINASNYKPDFVFESIMDLYTIIKRP